MDTSTDLGSDSLVPRSVTEYGAGHPAADARYRAMELLLKLGAQGAIRLVVVPGDPPSKHRVRFTSKGFAYTPKATVAAERKLAAYFRGVGPFGSNVAVACVFYRSTRQRMDVDNMLKAVLDAATMAGVWKDDSQVTALLGVLEHDAKSPRLIACFGDHESTMKRGDSACCTCQGCGKRYVAAGKRRATTSSFCSRKCRTTLGEPVPCPQCGLPFKRTNAKSKFCSIACRGIAQSQRDRMARNNRTHCRAGHELNDANTYTVSNGRRRCRRCQADAAAKHRSTNASQLTFEGRAT